MGNPDVVSPWKIVALAERSTACPSTCSMGAPVAAVNDYIMLLLAFRAIVVFVLPHIVSTLPQTRGAGTPATAEAYIADAAAGYRPSWPVAAPVAAGGYLDYKDIAQTSVAPILLLGSSLNTTGVKHEFD